MSWLVSSLRPVTGNRSIQIFRCACAFGKNPAGLVGRARPGCRPGTVPGMESGGVSPVESVRWSQGGVGDSWVGSGLMLYNPPMRAPRSSLGAGACPGALPVVRFAGVFGCCYLVSR